MASGNHATISKTRSVLSLSLVVVLSPLSSVTTVETLCSLSSFNLGKIFEDFQTSNKGCINIRVEDAMDNVQLIGWISPFTLLIRGCYEDMEIIREAWSGRILQAPKGFFIKDFGMSSTPLLFTIFLHITVAN